ncbi:unnamed protein product [Natator depressus]
MGSGQSISKGSPLAEILENWGNISGTHGLGRKKAVILCKVEWPALTTQTSVEWPPDGSFAGDTLTVLRRRLEDKAPAQMDYWYVWDNWAYARAKGRPLSSSYSYLSQGSSAPLCAMPVSSPPRPASAPPPAYPQLSDLCLSSPCSPPPCPCGPTIDPPVTLQAPLIQQPLVTHGTDGSERFAFPYVHRPFGPGDLVTWQQQMPRLRDDPEKVLQTIRSVFTAFNPTWGDVQVILDTLFTPDEKYSILDANRRWAGEDSTRASWPLTDPNWNPNVTTQMGLLKAGRDSLLEAVRKAGSKTANWSKIRECQQELTEHPSAFLARLSKQVRVYGGGINPEAEENRPMMVSFYVDQAASDIKKYFSKHVPDWPGKPLQEVVRLATFVFNGRDEEKARKKRKQKKEEVSMLAAALQAPSGNQHWQGRGEMRGRGHGWGTGGGGGWDRMREGNCNYCKQSGHWRRECPLIPRGAPWKSQVEANPSFPPNAPQNLVNPQ